jgi:uncharacterized repeat protein (TIGR04138 family)
MDPDLLSLARSTKYPLEAFLFVERGLSYTAQKVHGKAAPGRRPSAAARHVSGQQLCLGLRDYALAQYGMLARSVLHHWNIDKSEDFGVIVFAMIRAGLMRKTDDDSFEDFRGVYDFNQAFAVPSLKVGGG